MTGVQTCALPISCVSPRRVRTWRLESSGNGDEMVHDLKLRREILKKRTAKKLTVRVNHEFMDGFLEEKREKAKSSRRAASDLEQTVTILSNAPVGILDNDVPGEAVSCQVGQGDSSDLPNTVAIEATWEVSEKPKPQNFPSAQATRAAVNNSRNCREAYGYLTYTSNRFGYASDCHWQLPQCYTSDPGIL